MKATIDLDNPMDPIREVKCSIAQLTGTSRKRGRIQILLEHDETHVLRQVQFLKPVVRERLRRARLLIATAHVPGDQLSTGRKGIQLQLLDAPGASTVVFGIGEDLAPETAALQLRVHSKGTKASKVVAALRDPAAGHEGVVVVVAIGGDQNRAVGLRDDAENLLDFHAEARVEGHVRRPVFSAVFGAECGLHQLLKLRGIVGSGDAELEVGVGIGHLD